jgi:hypothetical protein
LYAFLISPCLLHVSLFSSFSSPNIIQLLGSD